MSRKKTFDTSFNFGANASAKSKKNRSGGKQFSQSKIAFGYQGTPKSSGGGYYQRGVGYVSG